MAIDVRKLGLQPLTRDEVSDMRNKSRFPEDLAGTHRDAVLAYDYLPLEKGKGKKGKDVSARFQAKVKILESSAPMAAGRTYTVVFWLGGDNQKYSDRDRQAFLAACSGDTVEEFEAEFDSIEDDTERKDAINEKYLDIEQQLIDASEAGSLADGETQVIQVRKTKTKEVAVLEDGVAKVKKVVYPNDYWSPVQG
jgi:hypothetical protein